MSKANFLVAVLILAVVGYVVIGQLNRAARTSHHLLALEVAKKIETQIEKVHRRLKRYPDAGNEFETLVLGKLDLHRYRVKLAVADFKRGCRNEPASFNVIAGPTGRESVISLQYFGCNYRRHYLFKGRLIRISH